MAEAGIRGPAEGTGQTPGDGATPRSPQGGVVRVDTHAHLAWRDFSADLDQVLARAEAAGLHRLLAVGIDEDSSAASVELARQHSQIFASVGLHPNSCGGVQDRFAAIAATARHHHHRDGGPVVAIGESGLDFYRDRVAPAEQEESFRRHLELAAELDLPIVIHNREADQAILRAITGAPAGTRGVLHCFASDAPFAEACLERGFFISFAGNLTYRSAATLREVAARVPAERLLVETDAPFLPPHPWRGKRNEPAYVAETLRVLCDLRQADEAVLARQVAANAQTLFGW